jgi:tetratricopeptide (TPR) repeat protein
VRSNSFAKVTAIVFICLGLLLMSSMAMAASEDVRAQVLDRGLRGSEAYAASLVAQAATLEGQEKFLMLREAIAASPDSPAFYFEMAWAKLPNVIDTTSYIIQGIGLYSKSFWWMMSIQGMLFVCAYIALISALVITVLIRVPKDIHLLVHDINESKAKILLPVFIGAYALLGPLYLMGSLLIIPSFYARKLNKAGVYIAALLLMSTPVSVMLLDTNLSASTAVTRAIVAVNSNSDNMLALEVLEGRDDFASSFSYAIALRREGRAQEAVVIYEKLLKDSQDSRISTNLGNAYVALEMPQKAKEAYNSSLGIRKTATALYNLSQVFRDELNYKEGDKFFNEAQIMDSVVISRLAGLVGSTHNRRVFDETLTNAEIRSFLSTRRTPVLSVLKFSPMVGALAGLVLLLAFLFLDKTMKKRGYRCKNCNKVACSACSDMNKMCSDCHAKMAGGDDDNSPKARLAKMLNANEQKNKMMNIIRLLSFLPPGIVQLYSGRVFSGIVYLWFFSFSVAVMALEPVFSTGLVGGNHNWVMPILIFVLLFTYSYSFMSVNRRLERGWL